jgi:tRNA threonylcarbamoyladenosine biosynthesis protein TsaB
MSTCLLAVDTATEICGVALAVDGWVKAELILSNGVTHTQSIMAAIETVLTMTGMEIGSIDGYAVTRGPGGFTGLRIGISTVKGLALATAKPMVGISSLEVLAHQAPADAGLVCTMMDARRNELYWALYQRQGGDVKSILAEKVGPAAQLAAKIDHPCYFIGNAVAQYQSEIEHQLTKPAQWANRELNGIRPSVLAQLARQRFLKGAFDDIRNFTPVYLRKSDAELSRKA